MLIYFYNYFRTCSEGGDQTINPQVKYACHVVHVQLINEDVFSKIHKAFPDDMFQIDY